MDGYEITKAVDSQLSDLSEAKQHMTYEEMRDKLQSMKKTPDPTFERIKARVMEKAQVMSTAKVPHTYMKAIGTKELFKILQEEL